MRGFSPPSNFLTLNERTSLKGVDGRHPLRPQPLFFLFLFDSKQRFNWTNWYSVEMAAKSKSGNRITRSAKAIGRGVVWAAQVATGRRITKRKLALRVGQAYLNTPLKTRPLHVTRRGNRAIEIEHFEGGWNYSPQSARRYF